jgi:integrase
MTRALTLRTIEAVKPGKARTEIADGAITGLYLIVQPSGAKSWAVRYRMHGRPTKLTLGRFPALGLGAARDGAKETLRLVSEGKDPTSDKVTLARLQRLPKAQGHRTFEAVLDRFLASQRVKGRRTVDTMQAILNREALPYWRGRPIDTITPADVAERIESIVNRGHPVAARAFRAWVSKLFSYAVRVAHLRPDNPARATENPVNAKERQRKRRLDDRELGLVWKVAGALGHPFGAAVQLLILTGQRRDEVCAAPWREFNLANRQWIIAPARAKNGVEHLVPLSDAARDLVAGRPKIEGEGGFLFTTNGTTPIRGYSKWKTRLDAAVAGLNGGKPIAPWVLHDLRRTLASGWARLGIRSEVTERALNHTSGTFGGIVGVYQLHGFENERAEAMETWARHVLSIAEPSGSDNVVPLRPVATKRAAKKPAQARTPRS